MGEVLDRKQLEEQVARNRARGLTHAFANGCFDLLHVGHVRYLEAARREAEEATLAPRSVSALKTAESLARDALLHAAPAEAFMRLDEQAILPAASASPPDVRPLDHAARSPQPLSRTSGKRSPVATRRPAV